MPVDQPGRNGSRASPTPGAHVIPDAPDCPSRAGYRARQPKKRSWTVVRVRPAGLISCGLARHNDED